MIVSGMREEPLSIWAMRQVVKGMMEGNRHPRFRNSAPRSPKPRFRKR
jgi:hypothetical protein